MGIMVWDKAADEELCRIVFEAAGAATAPLLRDNPDYVFPSDEVADAVRSVLEERGITLPVGYRREEEYRIRWLGSYGIRSRGRRDISDFGTYGTDPIFATARSARQAAEGKLSCFPGEYELHVDRPGRSDDPEVFHTEDGELHDGPLYVPEVDGKPHCRCVIEPIFGPALKPTTFAIPRLTDISLEDARKGDILRVSPMLAAVLWDDQSLGDQDREIFAVSIQGQYLDTKSVSGPLRFRLALFERLREHPGEWRIRREESDGEQLDRLGTDGREWAREFIRLHKGKWVSSRVSGRPDTVDEDLLFGWFANAIEAGRNAGIAAAARNEQEAFADGKREGRLEERNRIEALVRDS